MNGTCYYNHVTESVISLMHVFVLCVIGITVPKCSFLCSFDHPIPPIFLRPPAVGNPTPTPSSPVRAVNHQWKGIACKCPHSMGWNCTMSATPITQVVEITPKSPFNGVASPLPVLSATLRVCGFFHSAAALDVSGP